MPMNAVYSRCGVLFQFPVLYLVVWSSYSGCHKVLSQLNALFIRQKPGPWSSKMNGYDRVNPTRCQPLCIAGISWVQLFKVPLLFLGNNMIPHLGHLIVFLWLHYLFVNNRCYKTHKPSGGISIFQKQSNDSAEQEVYSQLKG